jgi:hypothetical protein
LPPEQIRQEAKTAVRQIKNWFAQNSKRKICLAEIWYGRRFKIRRNTIEADLNKAAEDTIKG